MEEKTQTGKKRKGREQNEGKGEADPAWGNQMRIQILGDSILIIELDEWEMEDQQSKVPDDGTKDTEHAGQD